MLDAVQAARPTALCTIYDPRYPDSQRRRLITIALALLNDVITREAFTRRLLLVDLRLLCYEDEDFANSIERSAQGGQKIAQAITAFLYARPEVHPKLSCSLENFSAGPPRLQDGLVRGHGSRSSTTVA